MNRSKYKDPMRPRPLTEREREVALLVSEGASNKEAAEVMKVSVETVRSHILRIYGKTGLNRATLWKLKLQEHAHEAN